MSFDRWSAIRAYTSYVKVWIPTRPSIPINGQHTDIDNLTVGVDVTAELWVKRPTFPCVRMCTIEPWLGIGFAPSSRCNSEAFLLFLSAIESFEELFELLQRHALPGSE